MSLVMLATVIGLFAILALPLLVYTFLIFPNIDGVAQDISWYRYDDQSKHFLYWLGFWVIAIVGGIGGGVVMNSKKDGR